MTLPPPPCIKVAERAGHAAVAKLVEEAAPAPAAKEKQPREKQAKPTKGGKGRESAVAAALAKLVEEAAPAPAQAQQSGEKLPSRQGKLPKGKGREVVAQGGGATPTESPASASGASSLNPNAAVFAMPGAGR